MTVKMISDKKEHRLVGVVLLCKVRLISQLHQVIFPHILPSLLASDRALSNRTFYVKKHNVSQ